jgi:hypothetical protein
MENMEEPYDEHEYERHAQGKVIVAPHYTVRWQLWFVYRDSEVPVLANTKNLCRDRDDSRWEPFNPDEIPRVESEVHPDSRFTVNVRHRDKSGHEEPELIMSDFSTPLLSFLRLVRCAYIKYMSLF